MSWQIVVGVLVVLLAAAGFVWYKFRSPSNDTTLAENARDQANAARDLAEKQLAEKNELERKELHAKVEEILKLGNQDDRLRASLELLASRRGVH